MKNLLIIGAGGHGSVVADSAQEQGLWGKIFFLDDKYPLITRINDWEIVGKIGSANKYLDSNIDLIIAIGENSLRIKLMELHIQMGFRMARIVHPRAYISKYAKIDEGTVVFAQAAVNSGVHIGKGAIINTGCTVDHDSTIGKGAHLSPGVHVAGGVAIGDLTWIGIGASIIHSLNIGSNVIVGAGSVILDHIIDNCKVVGVPGRIIQTKE